VNAHAFFDDAAYITFLAPPVTCVMTLPAGLQSRGIFNSALITNSLGKELKNDLVYQERLAKGEMCYVEQPCLTSSPEQNIRCCCYSCLVLSPWCCTPPLSVLG